MKSIVTKDVVSLEVEYLWFSKMKLRTRRQVCELGIPRQMVIS